jgi:hypothetical protein
VNTAGARLSPATQSGSMFIVVHAWATLKGLGEPLGSTVIPPQTKSGGSIPGHMAQFARITCLEMCDLCPILF